MHLDTRENLNTFSLEPLSLSFPLRRSVQTFSVILALIIYVAILS